MGLTDFRIVALRNFPFIVILFLLTGCEAWRAKTGTVFSSETKEPLANVDLRYYGKKSKTDSLGRFDIRAFIGCISCSDFEVYFQKDGFQTRYINFFSEEFGKPSSMSDSAVILLKPTVGRPIKFEDVNSSNIILAYSKIALGFGIITLIASLFLKIKFKLLWITIVLWGNLKIYYNVIADFFDWEAFDFFLTLVYKPKWNVFLIPLGSILYWCYYFKIHEKSNHFFKRRSSKPETTVGDLGD